jgi:YD repeat-containing protein
MELSANGNGRLLDKHDAKGQDTVYTYSLNRVTEIQWYPTGRSGVEDTCARVTYTYDP